MWSTISTIVTRLLYYPTFKVPSSTLVCCFRNQNETFVSYEKRFSFFLSRFDDYGDKLQIPEPVIVFTLMSGASIEDNHCDSISATASNDNSVVVWEKKQAKKVQC